MVIAHQVPGQTVQHAEEEGVIVVTTHIRPIPHLIILLHIVQEVEVLPVGQVKLEYGGLRPALLSYIHLQRSALLHQ